MLVAGKRLLDDTSMGAAISYFLASFNRSLHKKLSDLLGKDHSTLQHDKYNTNFDAENYNCFLWGPKIFHNMPS